MQSPSFFEAYATSFHGFYWDYDFIIYVQPFIFSFVEKIYIFRRYLSISCFIYKSFNKFQINYVYFNLLI